MKDTVTLLTYYLVTSKTTGVKEILYKSANYSPQSISYFLTVALKLTKLLIMMQIKVHL